MTDALQHLGAKAKIIRRLVVPMLHRERVGDSVVRRVQLDGVELTGIVPQVIGCLRALRVNFADPFLDAPAGGS